MRIPTKAAPLLGLTCFILSKISLVSATPTNSSFNADAQLRAPSMLPEEPLDVEGYPVAPEGLELEQVHVYIRHGERAPVGVRLADPPASIPSHWMLCKEARRFRDELNSNMGGILMRRYVERKDGTSVEDECAFIQSTFGYGTNLRKLYIERLGFLPDNWQSDVAYFRSTNMPRTMESLQHIISGLYPMHKCRGNDVPPIRIRNGKDENLLGNTYTCKRLEILQIGFARAAATKYNPLLEPLDSKLSKYIGGRPVRVDGKPRASGIMDTVRAAMAHGIEVPPEFHDSDVVNLLETSIVNEWFSGIPFFSSFFPSDPNTLVLGFRL
ncbi:hypothetical protein ONZ45_g5057 [Pleurotus djamor]|nr:hypothetical protein ONZ45_g5057 [Pleurotus djamor]